MKILGLLLRLRGLRWVLPFIPGGAIVTGAEVAADGVSIVSSVVKFFRTPVGKWVGVCLLGLGLFLAGDIHRARLDRAERASEIAAADRARTARDVEISKRAAAEAATSLAQIQTEADGLKKQVADYESYIAAHGSDACRATPDAARRLRGL